MSPFKLSPSLFVASHLNPFGPRKASASLAVIHFLRKSGSCGSVTQQRVEAAASQLSLCLKPKEKLAILKYFARDLRAPLAHPLFYSKEFDRKFLFKESDLVERSTLGRGPGGQATNRRMQTALVKHLPTGIVVRYSRFSSLRSNRRAARYILNKLIELREHGDASELGMREKNALRRHQVYEQERNRIVRRSTELQEKHFCSCDSAEVIAFLCSVGQLPASISCDVDAFCRQNGVKPRSLTMSAFHNELCGMWAALLNFSTSWVPYVLPSQLSGAELVAEGNAASTARELYSNFTLPFGCDVIGWLMQTMPLSQRSNALLLQRAEFLNQCKVSEGIVAALKCSASVLLDVFGCSFVNTMGARRKLIIVKDGPSWVEKQKAIREPGDTLCCVLIHLHCSLRSVALHEHAEALERFAQEESAASAAWNCIVENFKRTDLWLERLSILL